MSDEQALFFECMGEQLLGVLHLPTPPISDVGMLLVVGGPQYRVGSHRQFVLLARDLAAAGIPVLRFDYRGMGDSTGNPRDFETISDDISAAVECLHDEVPGLRGSVLWGLCDAATANAFYAGSDDRVVGQIALNPWVRTVEGEAGAFIRHYYLKRLLSRDFWRKVTGLRFDAVGSLKDFAAKLGQSRESGSAVSRTPDDRALPRRLEEAQTDFGRPTLLILSGQDLTAREYEDRVDESPGWRDWMTSPDVTVCRLEAADHTFSCAAWRNQVASWSKDWIRNLAT